MDVSQAARRGPTPTPYGAPRGPACSVRIDPRRNTVYRLPQGGKDRSFSELLRQNDVDVVIATSRLRDDPRFRDDPELRSFLADDGDHRGFVLSRVPRSSTTIAVRPKQEH